MRIQNFPLNKDHVPDAIKDLHSERPWMNIQEIRYESKFIAWIDIMGTANVMSRSLNITTIFVCKLHVAVLRAQSEAKTNCLLYPLVDGVYITSPDRDQVLRVLKRALRALAINFILERDAEHHFMVRACLSHGPLIEGANLNQGNDILLRENAHTQHIVLGPGVAGAYEGERNAAPFGLWIDTPVRLYPIQAQQIVSTHFPWWKYDKEPIDAHVKAALGASLKQYFDWCANHSTWIKYPVESLNRHRKLVEEYFAADS